MKRNLSLIFALLLVFTLLIGCTGGEPTSGTEDAESAGSDTESSQNESDSESALAGATSDILEQIIHDASAAVEEDFPLSAIRIDPISQGNAPGMLGISSDDFVSFVAEATAGIDDSGGAFQIAVLKCKDAGETETVATMIQNGFDSSKWVVVFPEQSLTMISGEYILLAVGTVAQTDAIASAFKDAAGGTASDPVIFYKGEIGGGDATQEDSNTSEVLGSEG